MRIGTIFVWLSAPFSMLAWSNELPADFAVNPATVNMTVEPKVVVNSGRLEWVPFKRDLTLYPSLSYVDKRPTPKVRKVMLEEPLNGDPVRGRELALARDKGYCIVCHELPGEGPGPKIGSMVEGTLKQRLKAMQPPRQLGPVGEAKGTQGRIGSAGSSRPPNLNEEASREALHILH